jgi:hypothetical protein
MFYLALFLQGQICPMLVYKVQVTIYIFDSKMCRVHGADIKDDRCLDIVVEFFLVICIEALIQLQGLLVHQRF